MKSIVNIFPIYQIINDLLKSEFLCRHNFNYYDMRWVTDDKKMSRFNNKVWKNTLCYCNKCGVKKKMSMMPGEWGKWVNSDFTIPKTGNIINIKIFQLDWFVKKDIKNNKK